MCNVFMKCSAAEWAHSHTYYIASTTILPLGDIHETTYNVVGPV